MIRTVHHSVRSAWHASFVAALRGQRLVSIKVQNVEEQCMILCSGSLAVVNALDKSTLLLWPCTAGCHSVQASFCVSACQLQSESTILGTWAFAAASQQMFAINLMLGGSYACHWGLSKCVHKNNILYIHQAMRECVSCRLRQR